MASRISPDFPGRLPGFVKIVQLLLVLERVHRGKKAIIVICRELLLTNQSVERFDNEFFSRLHVAKDFSLQDEEAAIDAPSGLSDVLDVSYETMSIGFYKMVTHVWSNAYECGYLIALSGKVDVGWKVKVR